MGAPKISKSIDDRFELISNLVSYLNSPTLTVTELTKYLTIKTFSVYNAYAVYIMKLSTDAHLELLGTFGLNEDQIKGWSRVPLKDDVPSTDAVKEDRMIWIADRQDWNDNYPHVSGYPDSPELKTLINSPLYLTGSPIGVLGIMCSKEVRPTPEDKSFVDIVAGLVSLQISKQENRSVQLEERSAYLTKRQLKIISLINQQLTNMQIARDLGYSESTIRHETMRIYEILQVSGRREAVVICKKLNLID